MKLVVGYLLFLQVILMQENPLKSIISLVCINCENDLIKLKNLYPDIISSSNNNISQHSPGFFTQWSTNLKENSQPLSDYINFNAVPFAFQVTEGRLKLLKDFNHPIKIVVLNGSTPEHRNFFVNFLTIAQNESYIGYIELTTQFDLAFSFEVYRRYCPTVIAYNPVTKDLWLTFEKFTGNDTIDTKNIQNLLSMLSNNELRSIKIGWLYLYTKFLSFTYIYNNFHFMFNYLVGGLAIFCILVLLIFEKQVMNLVQRVQPTCTTQEHPKKN